MPESQRNVIAFWILGLCNNFAYVIMLSAAKDILESGKEHPEPIINGSDISDHCVDDSSKFTCSPISTGSILLADILPTLFLKVLAPFTLTKLPYGPRHCLVVLLQALSYIIVAISPNITIGII
uniref:Battenin n=2 Tax=Panagrolaimus sp. JU765 TaxID=591449 RepID=A0AC34QJS0_9BILA